MASRLLKKCKKSPDRLLCGLIVLLLLANTLSGCGIFPKTRDSLRDALSQGIQQARVDSILKASADSVLTEVLKTERFELLRREWGAILNQTSDSLFQATDTVLNGMVRDFTASWLRQVDAGLQKSLANAKTSLTDDQLKRYQKMLKVITTEVDKIDSQAVYDRLVHNVSEKMKAEGLEKTLRKDILDAQGLINQTEWKDKDAQVLRVLVEELKESNLSEAQIKEKLQQKGLEEHFESVKRSVSPPR